MEKWSLFILKQLFLTFVVSALKDCLFLYNFQTLKKIVVVKSCQKLSISLILMYNILELSTKYNNYCSQGKFCKIPYTIIQNLKKTYFKTEKNYWILDCVIK